VASRPITCASLADELEVTVQTVHRNITTVQAWRIPIQGSARFGLGWQGVFHPRRQ